MRHTGILYTTSIISGFCMMALEILGGRFLYPGFGSSIDVWAAIISVFILSLSVGYWLGGKLADRCHSSRMLGWILLLAAVFYLLLPTFARPFTEALGYNIQATRWGVLLAALVLFLPPSLLLGCVSPMLVKLVFVKAGSVGRTTGTLYAIGSLGNVLGVLITDYVLLGNLDLNPNLRWMGIVLGIMGIFHIIVALPARQDDGGAVGAKETTA